MSDSNFGIINIILTPSATVFSTMVEKRDSIIKNANQQLQTNKSDPSTTHRLNNLKQHAKIIVTKAAFEVGSALVALTSAVELLLIRFPLELLAKAILVLAPEKFANHAIPMDIAGSLIVSSFITQEALGYSLTSLVNNIFVDRLNDRIKSRSGLINTVQSSDE